jgi:hypothetical protein
MSDVHIQQGAHWWECTVTVTPEASPGGGQVTIAQAEDREAGG